MTTFKVGDRVRCVDDADAETFLNRGGEYTVIRPGGDHVIVSGCNAWMRANRFEMLPDAQPEPQDLSPSEQIRQDAAEALEKWDAKRASQDTKPRFTLIEINDGWCVLDAKHPLRGAKFYRKDSAMFAVDRFNEQPSHADGYSWESLAEMTKPEDPVNHPPHYTQHPSGVECITVTEHMNFCRGNAMKYIWRAGEKGDAVEDLRKAVWYLTREIERIERMKGGA